MNIEKEIMTLAKNQQKIISELETLVNSSKGKTDTGIDSKKISELETDQIQLENDVVSLSDSIKTMTKEIGTLTKDIKELKKKK